MLKIAGPVVLLFLVCCASVGEEIASGNWPRWRGPDATGSSATGKYPVSWDAKKNMTWKVELPGRGCSTPIVWNRQIILTTPIGEKDGVLSLDWAGKEMWRTTIGDHRKGKNRNGSGANPSPVTDGQFVFVYFKSGTVAGLDLKGELLWSTNLQERFGRDTLFWDIGTSPVVTKKHVVVAVMHKGESFLAAFEKATGKIDWKVARNYVCPVEGDHSYATPTVIQHDDKEAVLVWGAEHVTIHDAGSGEVLWSCGGFNPNKKGNWVAVASAVVMGDMVVVPYGRGSRLAGVKLGGSGDVTETNRLWTREDTGSFVPTPAGFAGKLYILGDKGTVSCLDPKTGKTVWKDALPKHRMKYYSSPTVVNGKMYAAREDGVVFVAKIDGPFEVLSENPMGEQIIATPLPVDNRLLLRGEKHLFCIE